MSSIISRLLQKEDPRRYPRKNEFARAVVFAGKDSEVTESLQLGEGGMLVASRMRLNVGDVVTIHFMVDEILVRARCEVLYIVENKKDDKPRVGVRFKALYGEYREIIRRHTA